MRFKKNFKLNFFLSTSQYILQSCTLLIRCAILEPLYVVTHHSSNFHSFFFQSLDDVEGERTV